MKSLRDYNVSNLGSLRSQNHSSTSFSVSSLLQIEVKHNNQTGICFHLLSDIIDFFQISLF
jgi:hypothetical protein